LLAVPLLSQSRSQQGLAGASLHGRATSRRESVEATAEGGATVFSGAAASWENARPIQSAKSPRGSDFEARCAFTSINSVATIKFPRACNDQHLMQPLLQAAGAFLRFPVQCTNCHVGVMEKGTLCHGHDFYIGTAIATLGA
jgi:hypothetical protein